MHVTFTFLTSFLYCYTKPDDSPPDMQQMNNNILLDSKYSYVR